MVKHDRFLLLQQSPLCMWQNKTTIWIMGKHPEKRLRIVSRWVYYHWKELPKLYGGKYFDSPFVIHLLSSLSRIQTQRVCCITALVYQMALFRVLPIIKLYSDFRLYGCSPLPILSPFVVSDFLVTDIDQKLQPTLATPRDPKLQHSHRIALQEILAGDGDKEEPWSQ